MAHTRGLGGTLLRAACCRVHADGLAVVLSGRSSDTATQRRPAKGSGGRRESAAAAAAAAAAHPANGPRPGSAVRRTPQPSPEASPAPSPRKRGLPAHGATPPHCPAVTVASSPMARPCSAVRHNSGPAAEVPGGVLRPARAISPAPQSAAAQHAAETGPGSPQPGSPASDGRECRTDAAAAELAAPQVAALPSDGEKWQPGEVSGVAAQSGSGFRIMQAGASGRAGDAAAALLEQSQAEQADELTLEVVRRHAEGLRSFAAGGQPDAACILM